MKSMRVALLASVLAAFAVGSVAYAADAQAAASDTMKKPMKKKIAHKTHKAKKMKKKAAPAAK
jgi:hypothetical protein